MLWAKPMLISAQAECGWLHLHRLPSEPDLNRSLASSLLQTLDLPAILLTSYYQAAAVCSRQQLTISDTIEYAWCSELTRVRIAAVIGQPSVKAPFCAEPRKLCW